MAPGISTLTYLLYSYFLVYVFCECPLLIGVQYCLMLIH